LLLVGVANGGHDATETAEKLASSPDFLPLPTIPVHAARPWDDLRPRLKHFRGEAEP
jgi:hypothetical protein